MKILKIRKVLVTGALGFIGSHLVERLIKKYKVWGIDDLSGGSWQNKVPKVNYYQIDLRNPHLIDRIISKIKPEIVFHLACNAAENKAQFSPIDITGRNWNSFINTLVPFIKYGGKRFIFTSSIAVYGSLQTPFKEADKPEPEDLYGVSKLACEQSLKIMAKVHGFEYVIARPHNCYDDKTEILTTDGFKLFRNLKKNDLIATLNPETQTLEYHQAYAWQKIKYEGKLYNFKSKSYDLMVTPDHKILVKKTLHGKWIFETADSLAKSSTAYSARLKCFADNWVGEDRPLHIIPEQKDNLGRSMKNSHQNGAEKIIPMELWCQFLGWYISEGSRFKTPQNYVISISQYENVNGKNRVEIIELIKRMGFSPYVTTDGREIRIFSKQLYKELDRLNIGKTHKKHIPEEIKRLDKKYLLNLFDTLMKGDGDKTGDRYTTASDKLMQDFGELCLKIRKSTTVSRDINWRISISDQNTPQLGDNRTKQLSVKEIPYDGYVYDVTVPNHIIFVRRNGKACWSSNCYGPRQNMTDPYRNVVSIWMNAILRKKPWYIYGNGNQTRCFSYIDDVVEALYKCGFDSVAGKTFNIGSDLSCTLNELSKNLGEVTQTKTTPHHLPARAQEVKEAVADHTLAKRYLKYEDRTDLVEGLRKMWEWCKRKGPQKPVYTKLEIDSPKVPRNWRGEV